MKVARVLAIVSFVFVFLPLAAKKPASVFARDNLVAWCIVPFDAKQRNPEQRAEMLARLGIGKFAYDWRDNNIPEFDREVDALEKHGVELTAFWLPVGADPAGDKNVAAILDLLKRRKLKPQLWVSLGMEKALAALPQEQKVEAAAKPIAWVAAEAKKLGCPVALYNHGGWFGDPENQIAIIRRLKLDGVGIVYNFHHGRPHMDRFAALFAEMLPYLKAVNINGMKKDAPMILPVGEGDRDVEMLTVVRNSGYRGPIGILGHREDLDAEVALRGNIEGLKKTLAALGDKDALKTY
ncbi:MAG: hypothetical protein KIT09_04245 [Bryobacteraceae bacterium]|nr:hypothetical protein [Bryobacteraceae bacterium]